MAEFKKDHERSRPEMAEALPNMPDSIRFEDEVPHRDPKTAVAVSLPPRDDALPEGEYRIDGRIYVTSMWAVELLGTSNLKTIVATTTMKGWERVRLP